MANTDYEKSYVHGLQALVSAASASAKSASGYGDAVTSPELKAMLKDGGQIARQQAETIEAILRKAGGQPSGKPDRVIEGIIEAGKAFVGEASDPHVRDAAVVATVQIGLHYYIAAYGTLASTAKHLGRQDEMQTITSMNQHLKQKDEDYTKLVETTVNKQASAA